MKCGNAYIGKTKKIAQRTSRAHSPGSFQVSGKLDCMLLSGKC